MILIASSFLLLHFGLTDGAGAGPAPAESSFIQSLNQFSLDLFGVLSQSKPEDNVILSPFSLAIGLAMLHQGAAGSTEDQIGRAVFGGLAKEASAKLAGKLLHQDLAELLRADHTSPNVTLFLANKVYVSRGSTFRRQFVQAMQTHFEATLEDLDFNDKAASADKINLWVKNVTRDKINSIVKPELLSSTGASLLILNAIYLKGLWLQPFAERSTRKQPFYCNGQVRKEVDTMNGMVQVSRSEDGDPQPASSFALRYQGNRLSMLIVQPSPNSSVAQVVASLGKGSDSLSQLVKATFKTSAQVSLSLPKFKLSQQYDLRGPLRQVGIQDLNELSLVLDTLSKNLLQVAGILQKAMIEVNEKSTEAAAVTAIVLSNRSLVIRKEIVVDRPFIFMVLDDLTKLILFIGKVEDPSKN